MAHQAPIFFHCIRPPARCLEACHRSSWEHMQRSRYKPLTMGDPQN